MTSREINVVCRVVWSVLAFTLSWSFFFGFPEYLLCFSTGVGGHCVCFYPFPHKLHVVLRMGQCFS